MDDAQVPAPAGQPSMLGASFRDPSGFLFRREGVLYRQVNQAYRHDYAQLIDSGLYRDLVKSGLLIPHQEVKASPAIPELAFKIIQPEPIEFISYPYEWSFSQLKDAALLTLKVQQRAMQSDMSLKDSSAYNVQFHRGRPVLIDTLSFERYPEGKPWIAYRQFCQHFLAPLSLMSLRDIRLSQLLRIYIDGVPLDLASSLLPARSRLSLPLLLHIHLHASTQKRYAAARIETSRQVSRTALLGLIDSLETGIKRLRWEAAGTEWGDYYDHTNYTPEGFQHKKQLVSEYLDQIRPASVWDLGANTGVFSRLSSEKSAFTLAFDIDPAAIEKGYLDCRARGEKRLLPLVLDLTNPSPGLGWRNQERTSLLERGPADAILALALVHHLAIANNVPLDSVADFLARAGRWLVIEFVPKSDSQVQRLLANRQDIFPDYSVEGFERAFASRFITRRAEAVRDSERRLYLMERLA